MNPSFSIVRTFLQRVLPSHRVLMLGAVLFLPACAVGVVAANLPFTTREAQITQSSYLAADMLVQQGGAYLGAATPLLVLPLTNMAPPPEPEPFGPLVASHVAARLIQLGYTVNTANVEAAARQSGAPARLTPVELSAPDAAPSVRRMTPTTRITPLQGDALVTGQYAVARRDVLITLRLVESGTGRLVAAYDYSMPLDANVRALLYQAPQDGAKGGVATGYAAGAGPVGGTKPTSGPATN